MKDSKLVFVTDYGYVVVGPKVEKYYQSLADDLKCSKRTKKYKAAKYHLDKLEGAINVMAQVEWASGGVLEKTE